MLARDFVSNLYTARINRVFPCYSSKDLLIMHFIHQFSLRAVWHSQFLRQNVLSVAGADTEQYFTVLPRAN